MHEIELNWIRQLHSYFRSSFLDQFFLIWNYADSLGFAILVIGIVWYLINRQIGIRLFYILAISFLLNSFLKHIFNLPRPCQIDPSVGILCFSSPGFPNGAAQTAILLAGVLFLECKNRSYRSLGLLFAFLMCFSRIYLGVHYFTDILGGLAIGGILLAVYKKIFPLVQKYWKGLCLLFPFFTILIGESIFQFGLSMGVAAGLLLSEKFPPRKKNSWKIRIFETLTAIIGAFLILKMSNTDPSLKPILAIICGVWFSFLTSWIYTRSN